MIIRFWFERWPVNEILFLPLLPYLNECVGMERVGKMVDDLTDIVKIAVSGGGKGWFVDERSYKLHRIGH